MDDLIGEFITETSESLAVLDMELVKFEQNPNDTAILSNIFRLVHTIKGTCGFLGLPRLEHVAHAAENVLGRVRDKELDVTPGRISIVLESLDHIKYLVDHLAENGTEPEGSDEELINRLNATAEGKSDSEVEALGGGEGAEAASGEADSEEDSLSEKERAELEAARNEPSIEDILADMSLMADASAETAEAPAEEIVIETPAVPAAQEQPAPKKALEEEVKREAVKEGLQTGPQDQAASGGAAAANQSIRVNLGVLENLMQMVGELVLTRNQLMQIVRNRDDNELKTPLQHLSHITTELQEGIMKTRMQPIGNAWAKFPRLIRDLSIELHKKIELRMEGAETELDRQLLEMIKDPLTHMVRNSCDHGLEGPEDRRNAGKPETGTVTLSAYHEGGHIIIKIQDDGRGVNIARVSEKAVENGLATEAELAEMSDQQIAQFIFHAGFSTAAAVTSVSGRGVGMDVVRTNIEKIGGTVELTSVPGEGSTFHIKIPLTLAIVSVLIVECSGHRFAIPQINVLELVQTSDDSDHKIETINEALVLRLRGKLLPLVELSDSLQLPRKPLENKPFSDERYIVVCKVGNNEFGVIVDRIFDTEEIVVKPVSELFKNISVFSGNTILGDGSVIMILDPNGLARLTGETQGSERAHSHETVQHTGDQIVSFLLFSSGTGAPKAVPLELVSRLEEIDVDKIEFSGSQKVIQYRGDLMRLTSLEGDMNFGDRKKADVIVFTYDNKTIGLVVDTILDIVEAPLRVKRGTENEAYLGSMVIASKTTDVVDVGFLLRGMIDDLLLADLDIMGGKKRNAKIMLVEDSIFFRKLTVPLLSNVGYKVMDYPTPHEALDALRGAGEVDLIVTDIEMPGMDGFQFAERVRDDQRFDHIPIVAFTSTMNNQFSARAQQVGMSDLILKTDREALLNTIHKLLEGMKELA